VPLGVRPVVVLNEKAKLIANEIHHRQAEEAVSQSLSGSFVLPDGSESAVLPEVRLILIGERWAGKSVSGNTILGKERFECGRTRTTQTEVRHAKAQGRRLLVVDAPGWSRSLSLTEIPEGDKRRFKLNASRCPPGPHAFLLVVPVDSAFSVKNRRTVEEHMKLLGERVWRHTVVLFTCGDFLGEKTIEQHIESEGESLRWLTERCWNRYHVFDNKDRGDGGQVRRLLQMVDEVARHNGGRCYQVDEQTLSAIEEKQREVAKRAEVRKRRSEEQRSQMRTLVPGEGHNGCTQTRPVSYLKGRYASFRGIFVNHVFH